MYNFDWEEVRSVFFDALEIETRNRQEFLNTRCGADAGLRGEVEGLLEEHYGEDNLFDQPVFKVTRLLDENGNNLIEKHFGKYKIVSEIGAGGMGTVFLATRDDGEFRQEVAIKVSRQIVADANTVKRFLFERQVLASLNHPFIAKLHDGGIAEDGSPFLIMEYIEGVSITDYVERQNLGVRERLELFVKVCEGVAYAHRNLIVHRDIKPSNILIAENGTPKLLDFGLAKLLEPGSIGDSTKTLTMFQALTPAYASPEQIEGKSVSTSADVYSLGVVLYELLTGRRPHAFADKTLPEILQTLENSRIVPPSEALSSESKIQVSKSQKRETNPKFKNPNFKSLRGDLDNIILKALRREPEKRYGSVEKFADDIKRYLGGLPIAARPATFSYRASKFYTRNKIQVATGVFILISLIAGIAIALWQADAAKAQTQIAVDARRDAEVETGKARSEEARARAEEEKAKKIGDFIAKFIAYGNPRWYAEGAKLKGQARVIDAVFEMGDRIDTEFPEQADIRAELHHKFAEVLSGYTTTLEKEGIWTKAVREKNYFHAARALELRKQYYGEHHELVARDIYYLWALSPSVRLNEEAELLARAIEMMRETNPKNLNLPYMLSDYAHRLADSSEELGRSYVQADTRTPNVQERREAYRMAARSPTNEGNYQLAERYYKEALPIYWEHYKEINHAIVAEECNLAFVLIKQDKRAEFEMHFKMCEQGAQKLDPESKRRYIEKLQKFL